MKTTTIAVATALLPASIFAQTITSADFFNPDFRARREGAATGLFSVTVSNSFETANSAGSPTSWEHSAGGFAQARASLFPLSVDAQLAAYTQTTGDTLVFGREITINAPLGIGGLSNTVNSVTGAAIDYSWQASAEVTGLTITPGQLYQVDFTVTSGAGLPVGVLDSSTFGITTAGVTGASNESAQLLNVLNLLSVGNSSSTGDFRFVFKSDTPLNKLDFEFAANTLANVSALGGTAGNQNVLTYSGFTVTQIPEPSAILMSGIAGIMLAFRRGK